MHLSRMDVDEGQHLVTGPYRHWAVRRHNAYLDPAKLLRMNLSSVR